MHDKYLKAQDWCCFHKREQGKVVSIVQRKEVSQKSKALLELSSQPTNILGMAESDLLDKGEQYQEMFKTRV